MEKDILKYVADLGSVGAIVIVTVMFLSYLRERDERWLKEHLSCMETIKYLVGKVKNKED